MFLSFDFSHFSLARCTTTPPEPPAGADGEAIAYDPVFVTNVTPKLQEMVNAGKMTQDSMDLIIEKNHLRLIVPLEISALTKGNPLYACLPSKSHYSHHRILHPSADYP